MLSLLSRLTWHLAFKAASILTDVPRVLDYLADPGRYHGAAAGEDEGRDP